jgi:hypothetical protein
MRWKYIMMETKVDGVRLRLPVIFPEAMIHAEVARGLQRGSSLAIHPTSAGFVSPVFASLSVDGESESLDLQSRSTDLDAILEVASAPIDYDKINAERNRRGM